MSNIKLFESKQIRTVWNESDQKWYFVIADVVQVLTDTPNATDYIKKIRKRDEQLSRGWGQIVTPLSAETAGGKQKLNYANAQGLLRIIPCIAIREELTDEWKNRGIKAQIEYSILTAEMSKANFGLATSEYKNLKGLKSQNLRGHMTDLELIFSMLGEASTKEIVVNTNPIGFIENKEAAKAGGKIAGVARKKLEVK